MGDSERGQTKRDGYLESVSVEAGADKSRFHFPGPGFTVDYTGPLRPYLNWIQVSPSGHHIHRYELNERVWGFFFHKDAFVNDLLVAAKKAGAVIMTETIGLKAENTPAGVKICTRTKSKEHMLEAKAAIAADGKRSKIAESAGLNKNRRRFAPGGRKFVHYILEGVEADLPDSSFAGFTIPSLNPCGNILFSLGPDNTHVVGTMTVGPLSPSSVIDRFINRSRYASWFRHARIIKKECAAGRSKGALTPIKEPVAGNVLAVGDAGAPSETWIQGAIACGYQAVKAIEKKMQGEDGYLEYITWWQNSFAFNTPEYLELNKGIYPINRLCSDDEVDYIYSRFKDRLGIPQLMIARNLDIIKKERPALYEKFAKSKSKPESDD